MMMRNGFRHRGFTRHGFTRHGFTRCDIARHGLARHIIARRSIARRSIARHGAFTLVEVLAVTVVMALLSTFVLFAMHNALDEGKAARTRSQMVKLQEILLERLEGYRYRPAPVRIPPSSGPATVAAIRLKAVRELMRLEMPDRISDVTSNVATAAAPVIYAGTTAEPGLSSPPAANAGYLKSVKDTWTAQFQGAECLYLIISQSGDIGSPSLDFFQQSEIGDVDTDGMPELLDGFGRPIEFLRWAPGFVSSIQLCHATNQHDPFDYLKLDANAFALFPLVFSGGIDKTYNFETAETYNYVTSATTPPNPYGSSPLAGTPLVSTADDIHSHEIEVK